MPAKLKDLLRVPPLLNVLHTQTPRVCVPNYTHVEITFHMTRNNKGGRKSQALLVSPVTRAICHLRKGVVHTSLKRISLITSQRLN